MKRLILFFTVVCFSIFLWGQEEASDYRTAAKQGNAEAQYHLGVCYEKGYGVIQSDTQAMFWYEKAAEQGIAAAQTNLGTCYARMKDYTQAVDWYRKAAEQGDVEAQFKLGISYEDGYGVKKDGNTALYWYEKALNNKENFSKERKKFIEKFIQGLKEKGYSSSRAKEDSALADNNSLVFKRYEEPPEHIIKQIISNVNFQSSEENNFTSKYTGQIKNSKPHGYGVQEISGQNALWIALWNNGEPFVGILQRGDIIDVVVGGIENKIQYSLETHQILNKNVNEQIKQIYQYQRIAYPNGDRYEGETRNGVRDGYGIYYGENGNFWFGRWENGIRNGYGAHFDKNKQVSSMGKWIGPEKQ
jgi:tetratricopeptide (TPR) repeat protein